MITSKPETLHIDDWVLKAHIPPTPGLHPVYLLIHGWTGDENSMWVFGSQLSPEAMIFTPRAPHLSNHPKFAGYSWSTQKSGDWSSMEDLYPSIIALKNLLDQLQDKFNGDFSKINIAGFSQGAALTYGFALNFPERVSRIAALAGFTPDNFEYRIKGQPLNEIPTLIAHGTQDDTVPIAKAKEANKLLSMAGARVTYCESNVGHKLGANCFREFKDFMAAN